jgi:hypothetical protein
MVRSNRNLEIEGTWEEILRRSNDLAGRRVRVTVLDAQQSNGLREAAQRFLKEVEQLQPDALPERNGDTDFAKSLSEKYRKQGLDL